jgi:hypothetical protein
LTNPSDMTDDEAFLRFLRPFAQTQDGVPAVALEQAASAFRFASPTEALASRRDSDDLALSGARSVSAVRVLEFDMPGADGTEAQTLSIEFVGSRLIGHAPSGGLSDVACRTTKGQSTADRLDDGSFEFDEFPAGPFCLLVDIGGRAVQTEWIVQA